MSDHTVSTASELTPEAPVKGEQSLLTAEQVARKLGLSRNQVYVLTKQGRIPAVQVGKVKRYRHDVQLLAPEEARPVAAEVQEQPHPAALVDAEALAKILSVTRNYVYSQTNLGLIPFVNVGRMRRYNVAEVVEALKLGRS
jgi:excisionase family DNA binding protein